MSDNNQNEYRLPKRINDPMLLWVFPISHILPVFFSIGSSIIFGNTLLFLTGGLTWYFLISYLDVRYPPGYLLHRVWWAGLTKGLIKETRTVPDPMNREFFQ